MYPPFAALAAAGSALGHNFFVLDPDGPLRHTVPFARSGTHALPSLGLAAALEAAGIAPRDVRFDGNRLLMRRSRDAAVVASGEELGGHRALSVGAHQLPRPGAARPISSRRTYPTYSFFDLAAAEQEILNDRKPAIDPALFRDRIVFVGTTASGLFDVFETPFSNGRMPGINIHAAVADDVLSESLHPRGASVASASRR